MPSLRLLLAVTASACASAIPAQTTTFGNGCGPLSGPSLVARSPAVLGGVLDLHSELGLGGLTYYLFGFSNQVGSLGPLPMDLGTLLPGNSGCNLYVSTDWATVGPFFVGVSHSLMVQLPSNPAFLGMRFFNQALVISPFLSPLRLQTSNALDITIQ